MISHFNHRFADAYTVASGQRSGRAERIDEHALLMAERLAGCRYWVRESDVKDQLSSWGRRWLISYMDVCSVTNERTMIPSVIPWSAPSFSLRVLSDLASDACDATALVANLASFPFDYYVRQFVGGLHLSDYIMHQMAIVPRSRFRQRCPWDSQAPVGNWLANRVSELSYTAWDLEPFARDLGYEGPPFRWDDERRFLLRCELDAAFFHLYLASPEEWERAAPPDLKAAFPTPRHAVDYIMDTFPIVRRHDEQAHGEYRTKRVILEIYDALQRAITTGKPYQTRLDPPPADPRVSHPPR